MMPLPLVENVEEDLSCEGCGYNLRGLSGEGRCPECGKGIGESIQIRLKRLERFGPTLEDAPAKWFLKMSVGAWVFVGSAWISGLIYLMFRVAPLLGKFQPDVSIEFFGMWIGLWLLTGSSLNEVGLAKWMRWLIRVFMTIWLVEWELLFLFEKVHNGEWLPGYYRVSPWLLPAGALASTLIFLYFARLAARLGRIALNRILLGLSIGSILMAIAVGEVLAGIRPGQIFHIWLPLPVEMVFGNIEDAVENWFRLWDWYDLPRLVHEGPIQILWTAASTAGVIWFAIVLTVMTFRSRGTERNVRRGHQR
jgi:hypothetical protein